ncbi:peptidoglycan-binding protein [Streptomyces sp. 549]|uniref:peptidoglycan-binding protein n=1 Tax=Streptomyces sp. 549 TaxID=3049076 RepID=UPI0024C216D1|nr:peptidoglycan-binding protein [Streptomyces sp. 549]MDK1474907.1 peptidoglycan-binding protein [Streptomyces sp. 549]
MSQWKELPTALDPRAGEFVHALRRLKDSGGLSFATLAKRTSYSKSSWERYLNGKNLPPADAVSELGRVCGEDVQRLLELRSAAAEHWHASPAAAPDRSAGAAPAPVAAAERTPGDGDPAPGPDGGESAAPSAHADGAADGAGNAVRRRSPRMAALVGAVAVVLGVLVAAAVVLLPSSKPTAAENRRVESAPFAFTPGTTYSCDIHREAGLLHAGRSDTVEALLQQITTSWDVVEAQCLLRYRGYDVGEVDGAYGAATERAVKRLQDDNNLVVDGIMGPHSWEVLRR